MAAPHRHKVAAGLLASIPNSVGEHLATLRRWPGIEVCEQGDRTWLRVSSARANATDDALNRALRSLLGCQLFEPLEDGQLLPVGKSLPSGYVPEGPWQAIVSWLQLSLPTKQLAGRLSDLPAERVALRLVRSPASHRAKLLRTSLAEWARYAASAPRVRLERFTFAACADRAIVTGDPLPPIRGEWFHAEHGVAAPIGFTWRPAVDAIVVRQMLSLAEGDIGLLHPEGTHQVIRGDSFVGATRSAARLTLEAAR